ncbi:hypothetical protein Pmani_033828 [Petrolisthes manimaculis]|uniref:Uncharacterized protein n=1 Tax=Petrolisthes manimaculis TaxID=1843537 RepID=A0AAE1NQG7_9EUCA|nr:hypothetical protein Pmani_033828 [Petrolisthes manimaculis]
MYKLLCLVLLVELAAGLYHKPRPLVCSIINNIEYIDEVIEAPQVEVVRVPLSFRQVNFNTVYETSILPVTNIAFETITEPGARLEVTEVQLLDETQALTIMDVSTLTQSLVFTDVKLFTRTATNYIRDFHTISALRTAYQTVTDVQTAFSQVTLTAQETELSTVTVTEAVLRTERVVERVPGPTVAVTSTDIELEQFTNTHTLTKMITRTVCLPQENL